ncbi:MAG: DegT/DnrJ/EryC1/StrS family aminotransferase [Planctomycetota bacterium]
MKINGPSTGNRVNRFTDRRNPQPVNSVPLLDVNRGNEPLKSEVMELFSEIYDSGRFIGGPHVSNLEGNVAAVSHCEFGVGCASGSDALLLALMALDIGPGDEVICPSFTFFATASCIHRLGATPVFADIEPDTFNIDVDSVARVVTGRTKAIIPVHLFGQCANMDALVELAQEFDLKIVEDCAQSIGATQGGRAAGSIGDIGCFSFYPTKNLGGFGDGGMLTTNDEKIADRLRLLANHGMRPRYYHREVGINSRLDSLQAAVLDLKIKRLAVYTANRKENAIRYRQLFLQSPLNSLVKLPATSRDCGHVWNQFTIRIPGGKRDEIRKQLADLNVGSEVYYPIPVHQQECFSYLEVGAEELGETVRASTEVLSLPIFPELTFEEQVYVVESLEKVMGVYSTEAQQPLIRKAA